MRAKPKVLVVDDDRLLRLSLRHRLVRDGYQVDLAGCVRDAIDLLCRYSYDLLLTDLKLPDGSGRDVLKSARRLQPLMALLVLTGSLDDPEVERLGIDGTISVLEKPCRLADVTREAHDAVARRRSSDPN